MQAYKTKKSTFKLTSKRSLKPKVSILETAYVSSYSQEEDYVYDIN